MNYKAHIAIIIFILMFILSENLLPQTDSSYLRTEETLEDILEEPFEETDNSDLYDDIEQFMLNPLNLNKAKLEDFQRIPGLDLASAKLIVDHRNKYGNFFSVNELNAVMDLDKELIKKITPFFTVTKIEEQIIQKGPNAFEQIVNNVDLIFRSRVTNDLQTSKGFSEGDYEGTKPKTYNRLLVKYNDQIRAGYLAEKDAGESSLNEFSSYHFAAYDLGILKKVVVMDYFMEFGQGLTFWSPYGFSKGSDAVYPVVKKDRIIIPYTSSTENNFFRGAAASVQYTSFILSGFYSNNSFDANIDSATGDILSTPVDGYHRTELEISRRKTAKEKLYGGRIDYRIENLLNVGVLHYQSKFSNQFIASSVFDLAGDVFSLTSLAYNFYSGKINLAGEFSYNSTSVASINSFGFALNKDFTFVTSVRSYPRNFFSLHGFGFGERSGATNNEFGIYTGFKWRTPVGILNFYYDQFKFPYATFSNPLPSGGYEYLVDLISKPLVKIETRIRFKYEDKDITEDINNREQLVNRIRQSIRTELVFTASKQIRLKGRFEYNSFRINATKENENGYLFFQDIRYSPTDNFNFYGRIIFFRTDSFNSAVYEYENNLTGVLTNNALYGEGIRWYAMLRYRPIRMFTVSLRYDETYKPAVNSLGSGDSEIDGNVDNTLSIQIDLNI